MILLSRYIQGAQVNCFRYPDRAFLGKFSNKTRCRSKKRIRGAGLGTIRCRHTGFNCRERIRRSRRSAANRFGFFESPAPGNAAWIRSYRPICDRIQPATINLVDEPTQLVKPWIRLTIQHLYLSRLAPRSNCKPRQKFIGGSSKTGCHKLPVFQGSLWRFRGT